MKQAWIAGAALAAFAHGGAVAQESYYWPVPTGTAEAARMTEFPIGTPLALITRTEVNTKQAKPGDRVYLEVAENLVHRGQIVVPAGAPAVAEVIRSERNGHFGKKGSIELRLLYAQTPSGPVRLSGGIARNGKNQTLLAVGAVAAGGLIFGLIHGTSGYIRHGTPVLAYTAESLRFLHQPVQSAGYVAERPLPVRFDPSAFGGSGSANR